MEKTMKVLVTGGAGFIGSHLGMRLVADGHEVISIDNYSVADSALQNARVEWQKDKVEQRELDITDFEALNKLCAAEQFDIIYHLAAKPGVRESITNPFIYAQSNYVGTLNVYECAKQNSIPHVVSASSSSVYGRNSKVPFAEADAVDGPISVYASTKRASELLAYTYCHLFDMNITNVRFFTVYGPYGRPDMAPWIFTEKILKGEPIQVFDNGNHKRDFTYVDDIVEGCVGVADHKKGFNIINLGNGAPVDLMDFIGTIETVTGVEAKKEFTDAQPGDVNLTYADTTKAEEMFGYKPKVDIKTGLTKFVDWYRQYTQ